MSRSKLFTLLMFVLISVHCNSQDWANLNYYKEANRQLPLPAESEQRVVFMGNSIIEGWSSHSPEFFKNASFINRGIGGQTTPQMLLRFQQDVIDLKPETVVILAGINDIAENTGPITINDIANNINAMVLLAKANNIQVFLCSVLPANNFPWREHIKPAEKVIELNKRLKSISEKHNANYVDYFSATVDDKMGLKSHLGYDGVHPNALGYKVMEKILNKELNSLSKEKINLPDPLEAGWNGKKVCEVLKEDDLQRILKCTFPPNVGHQKHYHKPHFGYTLKGGKFKITDSTGTRIINVKNNTTWSKDKLSIHQVINVGNTTSSYLIIETKD